MLGHRDELESRPVDSVGVYARGVAAHPSDRPARYTLAACLGMLHTRPHDWMRVDGARRAANLDDLRAAACSRRID
jgi:hypothetical protein